MEGELQNPLHEKEETGKRDGKRNWKQWITGEEVYGSDL